MSDEESVEFTDLKKSVATMLVELVNLRLRVERLLGSIAVVSTIFCLIFVATIVGLFNVGIRSIDNDAQIKANTQVLGELVANFDRHMSNHMIRDEDLDKQINKLDARISSLEKQQQQR